MSTNRTFRVFVSSTFEDFQIERELLRSRVWPELENFCKMRGATFEAIDLRWGIPANSAEDLDIVSICLDEVVRCKNLSPRPNFIALIGDRYGWRPLPANIPEDVFELLTDEGKKIVSEYYLLDQNAIPSTYIIQSSKIKNPEKENEIINKIRNSIDENNLHPKIEDYFFKSATHLEIDEGIFNPKIEGQEDHFFACFREIDEFKKEITNEKIDAFSKKFVDVKNENGWCHDIGAKKWLNRLSNDIHGKLINHPDQIGKYQTSIKELSETDIPHYIECICLDIESWLKNMIEKELEELDEVDPLEIEIFEHQKFKEIRNETFGGREVLLNKIINKYKSELNRNVICIHGEGGSGKSSLLSQLISITENDYRNSNIVYRFIGASPGSVDLNYLLNSIVDELKSKRDTIEPSNRTTREENIEAFQKTLSQSANKKTFVFLDALDQLNNTENAHSLYWLPQVLDDSSILILSVLNGDVLDSLRKIYPDASYFDLSPQCLKLNNDESVSMLNALLSRKPARRLQKDQVKYILKGFGKNPLMLNLKLIAENARHWYSYDSIHHIEKKHLGVKENVKGQIALLFDRLSQKDNHGEVFVRNILALIALSREGMSDKEIQDILWTDKDYRKEFDERKHANQPAVEALPPIIWSRFFFDLEPFLMERSSGGTLVLDFFHRLFKVVVNSRISEQEAIHFHNMMALYFGDDVNQPVRLLSKNKDIIYNKRKLTELPFHQSLAGMIKEAEITLTDFIFLDSKIKTGKAYELMEDFQNVLDKDHTGKLKVLHLIAKAFRNDINFIARHPGSFFQSMFNTCWWHDHPEKLNFYKDARQDKTDTNFRLYSLMESWEKTKSSIEPGFYWLRSLQPPSVELDGSQAGLLRGLSSPVVYVSYSKNGKKIFAVCNRGELITWNAVTQNIEQYVPFPHTKSFMFKPNSKKKFTKDTVIMSDMGGVLADHPGFEYWAWSGVISKDGKLFLSGSFDGIVTLWKFSAKGNEQFDLLLDKSIEINPDVRRPVRGMAFSGNQKIAATGHADGSVVVWDINNKTSIAFLQHREGWVNSVAMNEDASVIVSGGGDGILYLWKKSSKDQKYNSILLTGHTDRIWSVVLSGDGNYAASGSDDKTVRIWDLKRMHEVKCYRGHTRWVQSLAFNKSAMKLASSGGDGKIMIWDVHGEQSEPLLILTGHDDSILSLSYSEDDKYLLSSSRDQSVRIWDVHMQLERSELISHSDRISCVAFSANGEFLVTGSDDKTIRMWNTGSGNPMNNPINIDKSIASLQISADNKCIIAGTDIGEILVIDIESFSVSRKLKFHQTRVYSIAVSVDSKVVLSSSQDGKVIFWQLRTSEIFCESFIENKSILSVALSPDYSLAAIGTRSGEIILLSIIRDEGKSYAFKKIAQENVFAAWVDELIFSNDGKLIEARGGSWDDRKIMLLDAMTLKASNTEIELQDGAIGSFGKYRMGFGKTEINIKSYNGEKEIAWYPRSLEFSALHCAMRQWAGVQRYNLHHFRLEGGE